MGEGIHRIRKREDLMQQNKSDLNIDGNGLFGLFLLATSAFAFVLWPLRLKSSLVTTSPSESSKKRPGMRAASHSISY